MLRGALKKQYIGMNPDFRFRGEEPGRLENFSDAVFALAITLLLISTSPPSNFDQIKRFAYEIIPFVLCITLILIIWHQHFIFFFRYGLRNERILLLNTIFLIIVLFYVYPLKFLTRLILIPIGYLTGNTAMVNEFTSMIRAQDMGDLMIMYGLGATSVFLVLMLMYRYALSKAEALELNEIEKFDTRTNMTTNLLMGTVPLLSVIVSIIFRGHWMAGMLGGFIYFLYTPLMMIHGKWVDRKRHALLDRLRETPEIPETSSV